MAGAFWCVVEDDRQGLPKKVMAEALGEAGRLSGGNVEAVWLTDKASDAGIKQLGEWGAGKVWVIENAALAPYRAAGQGACRVLVHYSSGDGSCDVVLGEDWRVLPDERLLGELAESLKADNVQVLYSAPALA